MSSTFFYIPGGEKQTLSREATKAAARLVTEQGIDPDVAIEAAKTAFQRPGYDMAPGGYDMAPENGTDWGTVALVVGGLAAVGAAAWFFTR